MKTRFDTETNCNLEMVYCSTKHRKGWGEVGWGGEIWHLLLLMLKSDFFLTGQYKTQTADYGLGTGYKTRTEV